MGFQVFGERTKTLKAPFQEVLHRLVTEYLLRTCVNNWVGVCGCTQMCVCLCLNNWVRVRVCVFVSEWVCVCVCGNNWVRVRVCVFVSVWARVYVYVSECVWERVCVLVYVCIYMQWATVRVPFTALTWREATGELHRDRTQRDPNVGSGQTSW